MSDQHRPDVPAALSRRSTLTGAATLGVALPLLAACGSDDGSATDSSADAGSGDSGSAAGSGSTIATTDIPVGGGEILADAGVVVTQPTAGEFKAFSATCTHSGCQVGSVSDGKIICPCHGSQFSITDGSVLQGPAGSPLAEQTISVTGSEITLG